MGKNQRIQKMKEDKYQKWKKVHDAKMKVIWKIEDMIHQEKVKNMREERDLRYQEMMNAPRTGILKLFKSLTIHSVHK